MSFNNVYYLVLFTIFTSCNQKTDVLNEDEKIKITSEILQMFDNYHKAIIEGGLQAEFEYLDSSSDFYWVPPGYNSALKYDSIKSILIKNSKTIQSIQFSFETIEIFPFTPTIANYTGIVKGKMVDTAQIKSAFKIIESGTLIKRENGWKLLNGQSRALPTLQ